MREKNLFVYKLFLSLHISNFSLFLCKGCKPLKKGQPPLSLFLSNPPPKNWAPVKSSPLFWKFGRRFNTINLIIKKWKRLQVTIWKYYILKIRDNTYKNVCKGLPDTIWFTEYYTKTYLTICWWYFFRW